MLSPDAAVERIDGPETGPGAAPVMLTAHDVATMLNCSTRSIYRLVDSGRMPRPVKLGAMVRWPRETIEMWIRRGCPQVKNMEVTA